MNDSTFIVAGYKSIYQNDPQVKAVSWHHFCSRLSKPIVKANKKDVPLFSPTKYFDNTEGFQKKETFKNAKEKIFINWEGPGGEKRITDINGRITRANKNVESISMVVFDFDSGNAVPEKLAAPWADFNFIIHSTWSHTADKGKYRLIIPLKKALSALDFKNIWADVGKIAGEVDQSCKDPSRMFYFPSCPAENIGIFYFKAVTDKKFYNPKIIKPKPKKNQRGDYTTLDVVAFFSAHDHYIGKANKPGQHWVKCPWEEQHAGVTGKEDAFVYEAEGNWPTFHCSHNTCTTNERNIVQVVRAWGDADQFCKRALTRDAVKTKTVVKPLGLDDGGTYYYQSGTTNHVTRLKARDHNELNFYSITSDIDYWYKHWGKEENGRVDWKAAARDMMGLCHAKGFFKPTSVRGSGCWWDENRLVVHMGDNLRVGNDMIPLTEFRSKYIYESAVQSTPWRNPLSNVEAFRISEIINQLPIPNSLERFLFSGHTVSSILAGALRWRPHVWLTGEPGSGKTAIVNNILNALWSPLGGVFCEGRTTEAGVRQKIRHNSVPIILDEVESNSKDENARVEGLIAMARSASSDSLADVAKGTISGGGLSFLVKSCFTFSSVIESLQWAQDKERFLIVNVKLSEKHKHNWPRLRKMIEETITTDFSLRFFSRCATLAPVIRENCDVFTEAIIKHFPKATSRNADQIGTHSACAWSLRRDKVLTISEAKHVLDEYGQTGDWDRYWAKEETSFGNSGLDSLLTKILRGDSGRNYSVGELVMMIKDPEMDPAHFGDDSRDENKILQRYGLKVMNDYLWLSKSNNEASVLGMSRVNFAGVFRQISGCRTDVIKFLGLQQPAIGVPLDFVFRDRRGNKAD